MIVYNVKARYFPMKEDTEAYRKQEQLPPAATAKIVINDRDDLAAFLNGALGAPAEKATRLTNQAAAVAAYVPEPEINEDWVPKFIREDWAKRRKAD